MTSRLRWWPGMSRALFLEVQRYFRITSQSTSKSGLEPGRYNLGPNSHNTWYFSDRIRMNQRARNDVTSQGPHKPIWRVVGHSDVFIQCFYGSYVSEILGRKLSEFSPFAMVAMWSFWGSGLFDLMFSGDVSFISNIAASPRPLPCHEIDDTFQRDRAPLSRPVPKESTHSWYD
jgi:hypothetical protein